MEINPNAKKLAGYITDYVNSFNQDKAEELEKALKDLAEAMRTEHRTLQQNTMRMFLEIIQNMAKDDFPTDPRNEQSKMIAQKMMKGFAKEVATSQNISVEEVNKNWDVYKPSRWLGHI